MLIIRGVNIFPSQIETILMGVEGIEPHYLLIVDRKGNLDALEVQVEVNERYSPMRSSTAGPARRIEKEIKEMLGCHLPGQAGRAQDHHPKRRQGKAGHRQP